MMERLTYSGTKEAKSDVTIMDVTNKLANYEDTGLTPADIVQIDKDFTAPCQLSGESEKYYWRLNISEIDEDSTHYIYLNIRKYNNLVWISNKNENEHFRTRFSEEEYKELSEKYSFPFNMFVKEEMEE